MNMKILAFILCLTMLAACQSKLLTVHKIDVQQGNALDGETVDKVQIGMTKEQVQYVLGSPLITDSFHPDRWDYIYFFTPGYGEQERKQLTLKFDRDEVIDIAKQNIEAGPLVGSAKTRQDKKGKAKGEKDDDLSEKEKRKIKELENIQKEPNPLDEKPDDI
jgi:outer membrane protein assembly factor BamE